MSVAGRVIAKRRDHLEVTGELHSTTWTDIEIVV
jgi:hypothetical protein